MAQPYVGEIRLFAGNFAPAGWMFCDGSILPISQFDTLFNLIGTTYGGDGQGTFALPDLRGRVPMHQGNGQVVGQMGGSESVTLNQSQIPGHTHALVSTSNAATAAYGPAGNMLAPASVNTYGPGPATAPMASSALTVAGGNQPHENMAPFVAMSYIISLFGIFPSQS